MDTGHLHRLLKIKKILLLDVVHASRKQASCKWSPSLARDKLSDSIYVYMTSGLVTCACGGYRGFACSTHAVHRIGATYVELQSIRALAMVPLVLSTTIHVSFLPRMEE
jgi:hypothetical protein